MHGPLVLACESVPTHDVFCFLGQQEVPWQTFSLLPCHKFAWWCSPTRSQEPGGAVNDDDTEDEDPSPASSQKRESNAIHPWSRYYNNADKRRRRAPPALPQPQEAGVGPSGAGPSGPGPSAAASPAAAPAQAPAADPVAPGLGCDNKHLD